MIINHNIAALNTYRQLSNNNVVGNKSLEKLSSGLRINRAGDDAAGLAISEKMRAQIRGLDQAVRNAQDGISMIQTAEGNLNETHSILQRMRELADQAANDTNVKVDRDEIQKEINALTTEINRIGNTTEFNTQKLLRGDGSAAVDVGALNLAKTGMVAQSSLVGGKIVEATAASIQLSLADTKGADDLEGQSFTFEFNGNTIKMDFKTVASATEEGANTFEVKDAGNEVTITLVDGDTNQKFIMGKIQEALGAAVEANANVDESNFNISRDGTVMTISTAAVGEGQSISVTGEAGQGAMTAKTAGTFDEIEDTKMEVTGTKEVRKRATTTIESFTVDNLKDQIINSGISESNTDYFIGNDVSNDGAIKFLTGKGFSVGNETIEFYNGNDGKYEGTADFAIDLSLAGLGDGAAAFNGDSAKSLISAIETQVGNKLQNVTLAAGANGNEDKLIVTAKEPGIDGNLIEVKDGAERAATGVSGSTFTATFQIGANTGQSMTIEIVDMRSEALGVSSSKTGTVTAKNGVEASYVSVTNVTNGTDEINVEHALDVSSHDKATAAISVINDAIESVSAERSKLGAYQNRLEHTINNLGTSSENLTAAESRIRDVDMAKEMMEFTKMSILTQAAQAMLAQANQQPQGVLQLLR